MSDPITTRDPYDVPDHKILRTEIWNTEYGAYVRMFERRVQHGKQIAPSAFGQLPAVVENERHNNYSWWKGGTIVTVDGNPDFKVVGGSSLSRPPLERYVCSYTTTTQTVPNDTALPTGQNILSATLTPIDPNHSKLVVITGSGFVSRSEERYDNWGNKITFEETVIVAGASLPANTTTSQYSRRQLDCVHDLQIKETVTVENTQKYSYIDPETWLVVEGTIEKEDFVLANAEGSPGVDIKFKPDGRYEYKFTEEIQGWDEYTREYYDSVDYTFPAYVDAIVGMSAVFNAQQRRTGFYYTINVVPSRRLKVQARIVETLWSTEEELGTLFNAGTRDVVYDGLLFNVNLQNLLTNATTFTATTNSDDSYWGSVAESFAFPVTSPTATEYKAMISGSTELLIEDSIEVWKFNLYKRRQIYVVAK